MDYLLIGIDGCQKELFDRFEMPFMQGMIRQGSSLKIEEDLVGRGWVEICTGQKAWENDGYYEKPMMNGTREWSIKYNLLEAKHKDSKIQTLWDSLNHLGYRVGIMNVPTTNPAPPVNGFFVSGGGGGSALNDGISEEQCFPRSIKSSLENLNYIVDERVPTLIFEKNLYNEEQFFERLQVMVERRIKAFLKLSDEFKIDVGFLVFRAMVVVEFLAAGEIQRYIDGEQNVNHKLIEAVSKFYRYFDAQLKYLCESTRAKKIAFVSDHGMVPQTHVVDLNAFLRQYGFQSSPNLIGIFKNFIKRNKNVVPRSVRQSLKKKSIVAKEYNEVADFKNRGTSAFSYAAGSSFLGIYINDCKRFGGDIDEDQKESITKAVIAAFNKDPVAQKHGMIAICESPKGSYAQYWPDIRIITKSGYSPWGRRGHFVEPYYRRGPLSLRKVKEDIWTGTKSTEPLAVFVDHSTLPVAMTGSLADVYHTVIAELS